MPYLTVIDATGLRSLDVEVSRIESSRTRIYVAQWIGPHAGGRLDIAGGRLDIAEEHWAAYWRDPFVTDTARRRLGFPRGVVITPLHAGSARYRAFSSMEAGRPAGSVVHLETNPRQPYVVFGFIVDRSPGGVVMVAYVPCWYGSVDPPSLSVPSGGAGIVSRYTFEPDRPQE